MTEPEDIEIHLLIEAIFLKYGYDFRHYARASFKRRVLTQLPRTNLKTISELQRRILYDKDFFQAWLPSLTVPVTQMFRDPTFYKTLRTEVVPLLRTYPSLKIWHAGCASGEEAYSLAILLQEEGLYERATIYATDINETVLKTAKQGIYPQNVMKAYSENYYKAGGKGAFSDYYLARYDSAIFDSALKRNIVFLEHNLSTDDVFTETHLIFCRNVLIYFDPVLQDRVYGLFHKSLERKGFLSLGHKESLRFSNWSGKFSVFNHAEKIYRKE